LNILIPGRYCVFIVDLGNYGRNNITPRMIFEELRKRSSDDFTFTHYHWRRSGNLLLQIYSTTTTSALEARISDAINRVSNTKLNRKFESIFRDFATLQAIMQYSRENTAVAPGDSNVTKNGRAMKVAAVFVEPRVDGNLVVPWPKKLDRRVEVLGMVREDPRTLVALYEHPREGGDFGYVANAVKAFYARSGIVVRSTARALSVIDDLVSGRLKSLRSTRKQLFAYFAFFFGFFFAFGTEITCRSNVAIAGLTLPTAKKFCPRCQAPSSSSSSSTSSAIDTSPVQCRCSAMIRLAS